MTLATRKATQKYVRFNDDLCVSCAGCVKACPTRALRIKKNNHIHLVEQCIGCCECVRICPTGAVSTDISAVKSFVDNDTYSVAIASPVLFSQFPGVMPNDVFQAIKKMGFRYVIDITFYIEMFQLAAEEFIIRNRERGSAPWPLISPICPVVIRLIAFRFPNLLPNILPIKRPITLAAKEAKEKLKRTAEKEEKEVTVYHVTPCPSKILKNHSSHLKEFPYIDQSLGINDVYPEMIRELEKIRNAELNPFRRDSLNVFPGAPGIAWGMSGGEVSGIRNDRSLAVSGLKETINYLEKIEMGLFRDVEYVEFRTCPEGCLGGPLTATDKYLAKSFVHRMVRELGFGRRLPRQKILKPYETGWFFTERSADHLADLYVPLKAPLSIDALNDIETLEKMIKGKNCAVCGAPDCRTFAEDIVSGRSSIDDCLMFRVRKATKKKVQTKNIHSQAQKR
ncbi:MAG: 4Fe-4S dicluster domain-containing protein [Deltaproteobacteria bacterium]|nr:4Fe-4S dicluster domain-containing protein [Deltaproteobacteria bacterium]